MMKYTLTLSWRTRVKRAKSETRRKEMKKEKKERGKRTL